MTTKDLLKLSTRMFTARRGRTALTILGMGIGFGAILFLVSLGYGLQNALLETITATGTLTALDVTPNESDGKILTRSVVEEIKDIEGVEKVEPSYNFSARIKFNDMASDAQGVIAAPEYFSLEGIKVETGKPLEKNNSKNILVSAAFGEVFNKNSEELVGQKVSFSLFVPSGETVTSKTKTHPSEGIDVLDYEIAGVTKSEDMVFYVSGEGLAIPEDIPYAKLKVKCKSSEVMGAVKDSISEKGFSVSSLLETVAEVNKLFRVINIVLGLFGIVTLAVSAIGMFNTMTVALLERTREIGIMRSIGASRGDIMLMFIIESTLMGFCGGLAGIALGFVSGTLVNFLVGAAAKYFGGKSISIFAYPLWFLGLILVFSVVIGFVTGIGPAKRASSLDPLEALRSR